MVAQVPTLYRSLPSTDRLSEESVANGNLSTTLDTQATLVKPSTDFEVNISQFEVQEAIKGKTLFGQMSPADLGTARELMTKLIDERAKNKGLSLTGETKRKIANILLLILMKTEDAL